MGYDDGSHDGESQGVDNGSLDGETPGEIKSSLDGEAFRELDNVLLGVTNGSPRWINSWRTGTSI